MDAIATDVWQIKSPDLRMPGGIMLPLSATVLRLADRSLLVYSPIAFDDAAAAAIDAAGEVAHIVAPNRLHHMYAAAAKARWPRAALYAAPGVTDKQPQLAVDHVLGDGAAAPWGEAVALELIGGVPKLSEAVLLHRPSGTLVCADLFFNITRHKNLRTRLALKLTGVGGGGLAQSRQWRWMRKDRAAAQASAARILEWPIARLLPCHGDPIEIDAAGLAPHMTRLCGKRASG
ncbi:MAG TPA: DUF4336 domain-containing protein [Kofleriaceae bacterium]|nr:DUF4336 domain-containing protein [Kofleriaceae bacterium]